MIIFKHNKINYVYLHIPKCNGKYIRNIIKKQFEIVKEYWGLDDNRRIDLAHMPYNICKNYLNPNEEHKFISFIRNPYDRIVSAYLYLYGPNENFTKFITEEFKFMNFFDYKKIHFWPQYKFLEENVEVISFDDVKSEQKVTSCDLVLENLNVKKYNIKKYFNIKCLKIINKFYEKDIKLCNLHKINYAKYLL